MSDSVQRLLRSPMICAIAAGLAIAFAELHLPLPVMRTIDLLAAAAGPIALFVIGATLYGMRLQGMVSQVSAIVLGKLILHPLAIWAALQLFPIQNPDLQTAAVLMAAVPMLGIYPLLGQSFALEKQCAAALLAATLASFISLPIILGLLRH